MLGRATLLISGVGAMYCIDYKKVVALSTLRQLSFITICIRLNAPYVAFFHLLTHALFKSRLFMSIGGFIHFSNNNQDTRIANCNKFTFREAIGAIIPILSITGVTRLSGFISKELILMQRVRRKHRLIGMAALMVGVLFTIIYRVRLITAVIGPIQQTTGMLFTDKNLNTSRVLLVIGRICYGAWTFNSLIINNLFNFNFNMRMVIKTYLVGVVILLINNYIRFTQTNKEALSRFVHLKGLTCWWGPYKTNIIIENLKINWDKGFIEFRGPQWIYIMSRKIRAIIIKYRTNQFQLFLWRRASCILILVFIF